MPRWWGTLLYPSALVALFLSLQGALALLGVPISLQASLAAVPAVAALLLSLPVRLRRAWGEPHPWQRLGVRVPQAQALPFLGQGVLMALALLLLELLALQLFGELTWRFNLTAPLLLNALVLGLGVGFAEELLFRGWLLGELSLLLGQQRALWLQAGLFSLVHTRFNLPGPLLLELLVGLLMLGLVLGRQRLQDHGSLWGAVGLHGGLVAGWFVLSQGLLDLREVDLQWVLAPSNPVGGLVGLLGLGLVLLLQQRRARR